MWNNTIFRLHFIVFLWGFTAILGKLISADAATLVFYRTGFAAIFLFLYFRFVKKQSIRIPQKRILQFLGVGVFIGFHWLLFFLSIKKSNVSITLSCMSLATIFTSFIEPIFYKRKLDWLEVLLGFIIVCCMGVIFQTQFQYMWGIFYGILCAFLGSCFSVFNGKLYGKASAGNIIFYEIVGSWLILSFFYICTGQISEIVKINSQDLALVLLLASFFTAFPMYVSVELMKYISPFTLILTVNLEPVYGIVLAYFIFGQSEHMGSLFYIAALVMLLAIIINGIMKAKRRKTLAQNELKATKL
ncbi:DMT family transporter [Riemerella columbipharyngis]|uniref:Permease of the drug/metabolite transporter (DMT) superfamily n=1 Tax=Riemerella columbipharyngis TaxID=1071918 RepID=A0A1G7CIE9_9FLAO|nr:DMT family transporter [Riemerella columbipharyngis]SDE39021.1 Permease of the drug/metabolite transporter (DMT) superfamily [Riemerella columbipharyngis]